MEESGEAAMSSGGGGGGSGRRTVPGASEGGVVGVDDGGGLKNLHNATEGGPLRRARGLLKGCHTGAEAVATIRSLLTKTPAHPARARAGTTWGQHAPSM